MRFLKGPAGEVLFAAPPRGTLHGQQPQNTEPLPAAWALYTYLFSDFLFPQVEKDQKRDWVPSELFDTVKTIKKEPPPPYRPKTDTHTHTHPLSKTLGSQDAHFPGISIGLGSRV